MERRLCLSCEGCRSMASASCLAATIGAISCIAFPPLAPWRYLLVGGWAELAEEVVVAVASRGRSALAGFPQWDHATARQIIFRFRLCASGASSTRAWSTARRARRVGHFAPLVPNQAASHRSSSRCRRRRWNHRGVGTAGATTRRSWGQEHHTMP